MDETDAGRLQTGLPVRISLDPYPDQTFPGTLTRIAPFVQDIEGQNRTVDVEAEFEDESFASTVLPGTSADLEVILSVHENVLRIPTYALMEGNKVLVVENGKLVSRTVKPGLRNWEYVEVLEGVTPGEMIALSLDLAEVAEGATVTVKQEGKK
jgi:HlyD family secretion protein